jgi:hypothetical protein
VLCGDFFQLPPVTRGGDSCDFLFLARCWRAVVEQTINLTEVRAGLSAAAATPPSPPSP